MGGSSSRNTSNQSSSNTSVSYGIQNGTGIWGNVGTYDSSTKYLDIVSDSSNRSVTELSGQYAGLNNSGSFSVTDGGAFDTVKDVSRGAFDLADRSTQSALLSNQNVSLSAFDLVDRSTSNALLGMQNTAYAAISSNENTAITSIASGNALARDLAAESNLLARESIMTGGLLGKQLMDHVASIGQQKDQFTQDTTRYALQFADNVSRSDGQQLAVQTNKTMLYIALAAAGVVAVIALKGK